MSVTGEVAYLHFSGPGERARHEQRSPIGMNFPQIAASVTPVIPEVPNAIGRFLPSPRLLPGDPPAITSI